MLLRSRRLLTLHARRADDLMTADPVAIARWTSIRGAAARMRRAGLTAAPVTDERNRPIGMVSLRGCDDWEAFTWRAASGGRLLPSVDVTSVEEIMLPLPPVVVVDTPADEVIDELRRARARRALVVDRHGCLVGIISVFDALALLEPHAATRASAIAN